MSVYYVMNQDGMFLSYDGSWVIDYNDAVGNNLMVATNLKAYYNLNTNHKTITISKEMLFVSIKPCYIIKIGHLFYGDNGVICGGKDDAFVFTDRTDALEILDWLEYHKITNTEIVEINVNKDENTYKEISDLFGAQRQKGEVKYGGTVDEKDNDDPVYWINHAREEVADLLVYLTKLGQKLKGGN